MVHVQIHVYILKQTSGYQGQPLNLLFFCLSKETKEIIKEVTQSSTLPWRPLYLLYMMLNKTHGQKMVCVITQCVTHFDMFVNFSLPQLLLVSMASPWKCERPTLIKKSGVLHSGVVLYMCTLSIYCVHVGGTIIDSPLINKV